MTYNYQLYGLNIISEINFPELNNGNISDINNVVNITIKKVNTKGIKNPKVQKLYYQMNEKESWYHIPKIGRFLIRNGNAIHISPAKNIDDDTIRECILTFCLQNILIQKGYLTVSGAVIQIKNSCVALFGTSGAGKSTLAAALYKKGYKILTDDLVVINNEGKILAGYPYIKLWKQALLKLNIDHENLRQIRPQIHKYLLPVNTHNSDEILSLDGIYIIQDVNNEDYVFELLTGVKKIKILQNFFNQNPDPKFLPRFINLAQRGFIETIIRPHNDFKIEDCVKHIEDNFEKKELNYG